MDRRDNRRGEPWHESAGPDTDMRSHYVGAYGVYDYDEPVDPGEFGGTQGTQGGQSGSPPEARARQAPRGRDPYRQFTGYNERMDLYRGGPRQARPVGPRNYQRSDARILEDLCEQLAHSARLQVEDVEVRVEQGVVTLEGSVPQRQQKYGIEDVADEVYGVREVVNHLRVARGDTSAVHPGHGMRMY
ncbi:BON domain-containing protein [Cupriavidus sp. P-10]|uniref:BON domain-containing protein n=1 Tax=unclassified Cupriavidus TaxID=2640874 RepID=UPI000E2F412A|nr:MULTISPECIES: BON domain-containing protein [unclassified Cupriavidus]BDB27652.1 BON domain-containing protein [Cupriavidus sp. P-10]